LIGVNGEGRWGFISHRLKWGFRLELDNLGKGENEETSKLDAWIDDKCLWGIVLIKGFPREGWLGKRTGLGPLRMVRFVLVIEQLNLKREIVESQDEGYATMEK